MADGNRPDKAKRARPAALRSRVVARSRRRPFWLAGGNCLFRSAPGLAQRMERLRGAAQRDEWRRFKAIEDCVKRAMERDRDLLDSGSKVFVSDVVADDRGRWAVRAYHPDNHDHPLWYDLRTGYKLRSPGGLPVLQPFLRRSMFRNRSR